jgi:hypothetical protein
MFGFVSDIGTKIPSNDAVPSGIIFLVKFLLNIRSNVLLVCDSESREVSGTKERRYLLDIIFL